MENPENTLQAFKHAVRSDDMNDDVDFGEVRCAHDRDGRAHDQGRCDRCVPRRQLSSPLRDLGWRPTRLRYQLRRSTSFQSPVGHALFKESKIST